MPNLGDGGLIDIRDRLATNEALDAAQQARLDALEAGGTQGPQGETGPAGADGAVGPAGPKGDTGDTGPQGVAGVDGTNGVDGQDGANGSDGAQGPIGLTGPAGADGQNGNDGAVGPKGDTGDQGPVGLTGADGIDGQDGAQGVQGIQGPAGNDGADGQDGAAGATGPKGDKGDAGDTGPEGPQGPAGEDGEDGLGLPVIGAVGQVLRVLSLAPLVAAWQDAPTVPNIIQPLGGGFLLDPNEFNGWGATGPFDDVVTHDLGNVGANLSRVAGGLMFPFDVRLKRFKAKHYNNNNLAEAWGWRITKHSYTAGLNTISWENILDEVGDNAGIGPRNYLSTTTQETDIAFDDLLPAGEVLTLGVEAPTAITTNRYCYIMAGFFEFEPV